MLCSSRFENDFRNYVCSKDHYLVRFLHKHYKSKQGDLNLIVINESQLPQQRRVKNWYM